MSSVLCFFGAWLSYRAIQNSNCHHREGHNAPCSYEDTSSMLLFGAVQVVMSQIPDFHNMKWLSMIATIMSFAYSLIGFGLGFAQVIGITPNSPSVLLIWNS